MNIEQLKARLQTLDPQAQIDIVDLTGTEDHYKATITSSVFSNLSKVCAHQRIYQILDKEMASGEVHALTLDLKTP